MIRDGLKMSPSDAQEEYEEVQADLRKKEEEVMINFLHLLLLLALVLLYQIIDMVSYLP